ncbi:MAG: oligosaccharide flippase family protein [Candidatus Lokiarchaeota archaeon]|nr:oligosaccharide flippase family protein [Candidatus Harpocratesius repetitus]
MIGRKALLALGSQLLVNFLHGITYIIAISRFIPTDFGYYQVAISLMSIFTIITNLGFQMVHLKIMSEDKNSNQVFSVFFFIKFILIIIASILLFIFVKIQMSRGLLIDSKIQIIIIMIVFCQNVLDSVSMIYFLSFQAKMQIARMQIPILIGIFIGTVFSLVSIFFFASFILYIVGNLFSSLIKLLLYIFLGGEFKLKKINIGILKRYFALNSIFAISIILNNLTLNLGPFFFLKYYDENLLGVYNVISSFFLMIGNFQNNFRLLIIPNYSKLFLSDKKKELQNLIDLYEKYLLIINGILIICGILFAKYVFKIIGDIYYEKGLLLYYGYLLGLMVIPLQGSYSPLLFISEKLKFFTLLSIINFLFSIISWIIFIPSLDILGINLGSWIFFLPNIILIRIYCIKKLKLGYFQKEELSHLLILVLLFISCFIIVKYEIKFFFLVLLTFSIFILYAIFLFKKKILSKADISYIKDMINPKKMIEYIGSEIKNEKVVETKVINKIDDF